ncbi:hypothetical protein [Bradyrhizobium sp. STM 3557]|uniref:hypothetical protein n=1 Tax=Bradyrhizobium sp. STM 3557 TaxID=578920 RepID=UPI00388E2C4C
MVRKFIAPIALGAALIGGTSALAADYRADEFFTLDLSKAVLSPKPIGPVSHFEPVPVEAKADQKADQKADRGAHQKQPNRTIAATRPEARPDVPRRMAMPRVHVARPIESARGAARTKLAHRHGNPLDAQAMDTRIQTWPCRPGSGGICNWR